MEGQKAKHIIGFAKLREIVRNPAISALEIRVLLDLLLYAGTNGEAFPSESQLATDCGKSDRHIRTTLVKLKQKELIEWKKRGYSKSNKYTLNEELYFRNDNKYRKTISSELGSTMPIQNGPPLPPKVNQESNQLSSSHIQQLFEETSKKKLHLTDIQQLHSLCKKYTEEWVEEAIKTASKRKTTFLSIKYVSLILGDWKRDGMPTSKPQFVFCGRNGCENGYIYNSERNSYRMCECREIYQKKLEDWKKI